MKRTVAVIGFTLMLAAVGAAEAQEGESGNLRVEFSDPGRPGLVRISLVQSNIRIRGYDGEAVLIEYSGAPAMPPHPNPPPPGGRPAPPRPLRPDNFFVRESNNVITVGARIPGDIRVEMQVPRETSLRLNGAVGDIQVEDVRGQVTINTQAGDVSIRGITGPASVRTLAGDLSVAFARAPMSGPMTFVTLNGRIEATLPADAAASLRVENHMGELASDFPVQEMSPRSPQPDRGPRRRIWVSEINGGGPVIRFGNTAGDIVLRRPER